MEFQHTFAALFCLALVGAVHARESKPDEAYWQAVWPNTPIPNTLKDLLKPRAKDAEIDNLPMKIHDTQYPKTFFYENELYPGKVMDLKFSKVPFAQPYGVYFWQREVKDIEKEGYTSEDICVNNPASNGEHRYCAKSLETLIGFSISKLGKNIQVLSSSFVDNQNQYTIKGAQNLGDKAVMCHRLNFRHVVFYCHEFHETTSYMVSMVAADGTETQAIAVCHHDTSSMNSEIVSQLINFKRGTDTACHYLGNKAVLWVPNIAMVNGNNANMAT